MFLLWIYRRWVTKYVYLQALQRGKFYGAGEVQYSVLTLVLSWLLEHEIHFIRLHDSSNCIEYGRLADILRNMP
jgi:hypothetical protein